MIGQVSLLVMLVKLVDRLPEPPAPAKRGRGPPKESGTKRTAKLASSRTAQLPPRRIGPRRAGMAGLWLEVTHGRHRGQRADLVGSGTDGGECGR